MIVVRRGRMNLVYNYIMYSLECLFLGREKGLRFFCSFFYFFVERIVFIRNVVKYYESYGKEI